MAQNAPLSIQEYLDCTDDKDTDIPEEDGRKAIGEFEPMPAENLAISTNSFCRF
jgi:hypothetical protein